jgi:hypothetical protein
MNSRLARRRSYDEQPVWCDECRVRSAPYEEAAINEELKFHLMCYRKSEVKDLTLPVVDARSEMVLA